MNTETGVTNLASKLGQIDPKWVKISLSTFWRAAPKYTETDFKTSQICPIWGQSDSIRMANLTSRYWKRVDWLAAVT